MGATPEAAKARIGTDANRKPRIPNPDSRIPDPDSRIPTPDSRIPTPDSPIPNPDSRLPDPDSRIPTPDSRIPTPDSRTPLRHGSIPSRPSRPLRSTPTVSILGPYQKQPVQVTARLAAACRARSPASAPDAALRGTHQPPVPCALWPRTRVRATRARPPGTGDRSAAERSARSLSATAPPRRSCPGRPEPAPSPEAPPALPGSK